MTTVAGVGLSSKAERGEARIIISCSDAKALGLLRYFTGKPCPKGHVSDRFVSSRGCLECCGYSTNPKVRESKAIYYQKKAEDIKAAVRRRWRDDPDARIKDKACRDKRREQIRAYDRMRAKRDREKKKPILERWHRNNPERSKELSIAKSHRRRARERVAGSGSFTANDIQKMRVSQKNKCWWCEKKLPDKFHVDHRIPLAKGGTNDRGNVVIACVPCNKSKSAKMPWEFAGRLV
jgi:5-methylcytosine-specific restriction endonuclease McrA